MPNVMLSQQADGLYCYIAKKDLEARITRLEFQQEDCWGGRFELDDGQSFYLPPLAQIPSLPATFRVTKSGGDDES